MISRLFLGALLCTNVMNAFLQEEKKQLINDFFDIEVVKIGEFELKSGMISPIYIDLRKIISYPSVLEEVAEQFKSRLDLASFDCICGVPYTALPMATALSLITDKPMILHRKEVKNYGAKRIIEGEYQTGLRCLVVEDCFATGSSALETIKVLEDAGLIVEQVVIVVDREQGGKECVESKGYEVTALLSLSEMLAELEQDGLISSDDAAHVKAFIRQNRVK